MHQVRRSIWIAASLIIPSATHPAASTLCPPPIQVYEKCPSSSAQELPVPPWYIAVDTVVDQIDDDLWSYNWCLKSIDVLNDEFYVTWRDINWDGFTLCGGFAGVSLQASYPPSTLERTQIIIGSGRKVIQPTIVHPLEPAQPVATWQRFLRFLTNASLSIPGGKTRSAVIAVSLAIESTATPIIADGRQTQTKYQFRYKTSIDSDRIFSFILDPSIEKRSAHLKGPFELSDKEKSFEFTEPGPPVNTITSLTFIDPDGYAIGSLPVSLAVPAK